MNEFINHGQIWVGLIVIGFVILNVLYVLWDKKRRNSKEKDNAN